MTVRNMRQGQAGGHPRRSLFTRFSQAVARYAGKPATFVTAAGLVAVWAATGPFVGYSETWQLVINTSTTIITFLMVFIIQNSQNRDTAAVQIKLDELISKLEGPREILLDLEELDEGELEKLRQEFEELACKARAAKGEKRHAERGGRG